ncbi:MAG TPA: chemotaxis protein CheD [Gemmatimonadaceae bacterium]
MSARIATPPGIGVGEVVVEIADFAVVGGDGILVTAGLGSCVALALHDKSAGIAGLAHILLPSAGTGPPSIHPAKYADTTVPLLLEEMRRHGAHGRIVARLAGGARMFSALLSSGINMGQRNIDATLAALERLGIPVVAEDVGGEYGRSVRVMAATGAMTVRSLVGGDRDL